MSDKFDFEREDKAILKKVSARMKQDDANSGGFLTGKSNGLNLILRQYFEAGFSSGIELYNKNEESDELVDSYEFDEKQKAFAEYVEFLNQGEN